jgi:hypothetical protein
LAWTFGVAAVLCGAYGFLQALRGELARLLAEEPDGLRLIAVLSLLTGLSAAMALDARPSLHRLLADAAPLLPEEPPEAEALLERVRQAPRAMVGAGAALFGALVPPAISGVLGEPRAFLTDFEFLWTMGLNGTLFFLMAWIAATGAAQNRALESALTPRLRVDPLAPEELVPFARRGLAHAVYWLLGSSLASLLFLNFGFSPLHAAIVTAALALGTVAFVQPMRGPHRRLVAARDAELARVRLRLRAARAEAHAGDDAAAARLGGLLHLEERLRDASTWPLDAPSVARFGALGALAVGSWVGGALIERLVDVVVR